MVAPVAELSVHATRSQTARPIPVYAVDGMPRWVTHAGRRQRVVAVQEQPAPLLHAARHLEVQLASGSSLTLLHDRRGWKFTARGSDR